MTNSKYFEIEHVDDYFSYGKILREFVESEQERFLTTQHERDAETGLDYRGARYYDSDVARFLSLDPLAAKFPSWSDYCYVLSNPVFFVDPDGKKPTPKEAALMARHVYIGKGELAGGWKVSNRTVSGMKEHTGGYKAQLYERTKNDITEYSYVFAGTEDAKDWEANLEQAQASSSQHDDAIADSETLDNSIEEELTFVGHSLGGGLATAASLNTGNDGITFNSAWLSLGTIDKYDLNTANYNKVTNYVVRGEVLDAGQSLGHSVAPNLQRPTNVRYLTSGAINIGNGIITFDPVVAHSMIWVLYRLSKMPGYNKVWSQDQQKNVQDE